MTQSALFDQVWVDPRLSWKREGSLRDVDHLQVPSSMIWMPDLEILNR